MTATHPGFSYRVITREGVPSIGRILLTCEHGRNHGGNQLECAFPLSALPAANGVWQWNGNTERPTITPSINCHGGCGRHFIMTNGEI